MSAELLAREAASLHARIRDWPVRRFQAAALPVPGGPPGAGRTRGEVVHDLVVALAGYAEAAGGPAPAGARPPRLGDHALADQLAVLTGELLTAPGVAAVAPRALAEVLAARTALDGTAPPADALAAGVRPGPGGSVPPLP